VCALEQSANLKVGHEMRSVTLYLLIRRDRTENDFGKLPSLEGPVRDTSDDLERLLDDRHRQMGAIVDQARDIVSRHLGQLLLKDVLQTREDDRALPRSIIVNHPKFNVPVTFFNHSVSCAPGLSVTS